MTKINVNPWNPKAPGD